MSDTENGLVLRGLSKREIRDRVNETLELVGLTQHADSRPAHISGGEQQRVALARALVLEPKVLLLDEPLSNLDAKLRVRVRDEIREIQQRVGITTVLVTHDQDEALSVADRIAVMNTGRIEQLDTPSGLYDALSTRFVAGFVGTMNFLAGHAKDGLIRSDQALVPCDELSTDMDDPRFFGVRPENVMIGSDGAGAQVIREVPRGHFREVLLSLDGSATQLRSYVPVGTLSVSGAVRVRFSRAHGYPNDEV